MSDQKKDHLYSGELENVQPFAFDDSVAEVFADMIKRSVPGYLSLLEDISRLLQVHVASHHYAEPPKIIDMGCSLGAMLQILSSRLTGLPVNLIGVDNSAAMLAQAAELWPSGRNYVGWVEEDLQNYNPLELGFSADVVIMNFTLQFIPLEQRKALIDKIYQSLAPNGIFILSEKIAFDNPQHQNLIADTYHQFKQDQGYSELEVSQKRQALENVLIPETKDQHEQRFSEAGFKTVSLWQQRLNFASWFMVKE